MQILYEDSQIIVCYKEAGLPVQSARIGKKDLESILKNYLCEQNGKASYLGVVHRLDQPVEGVLVFAKNQQAAKCLSAQVSDGRMKKIYQAVVCMTKENIPEEGTLIDFLLKDGKNNTSRLVSETTKGAKKAELAYHILQVVDDQNIIGTKNDGKKTISIKSEGNPARAALVEIHLHTGRHHQIRVQMSGSGMPLLGDRKYGVFTEVLLSEKKSLKDGETQLQEISGQLALCAVSLELVHPRMGKRMQFTCEPQGEYFKLF